MKKDDQNWLDLFGLRDEDESLALIIVGLIALFVGFWWIRGMGGDQAIIPIEDSSGQAAIVDADADVTLTGDYLNTGMLQLEGTAPPNSTVDILIDDELVGSADVNQQGNWEFSTRVRDIGDHVVVARGYDSLTNAEMDSRGLAFSVLAGGAAAAASSADDMADEAAVSAEPEAEEPEATDQQSAAVSEPAEPEAPAAPVLNPQLQGASLRFDPTSTVNLNGSAEPDSLVAVSSDGELLGTSPADADGLWLLSVPFGAFKVGQHVIEASYQEMPEIISNPATILVNGPAPSAFFPGTDGIERNAGIYNIKGVGQPDWQVAVRANGGDFQNVGTDANGNWAINEYNLSAPGVYNLEVWSVDTDGSAYELGQPAIITMLDPNAAPPAEEGNAEQPVEEESDSAEQPAEEPAPEEAQPAADIIDVMAQDGRFTTLLTAINSFGLTDAFRSDGPFTIFAPTDAALAALPDGAVANYLANGDALTQVLQAHVVNGELNAEAVLSSATLQSIGGVNINIDGANGTVNGAPIIETDKAASNGVVHVIDRIILPDDVYPAPIIDDQGVPTFKGPTLTIVGTAQPGAALTVELNGETFGSTTVAADGTWLISDIVDAGQFEIIAYTYDTDAGGLLRGISNPVNLFVE